LAIHIPRIRLLSALALGGAFVLVIAATVVTRGISSGGTSGEASAPSLRDVARSSGLRFGQDSPALAYAPLALSAPPAPAPAPSSTYAFIWPNDYYIVQGMWAGHPLGVDIGSPAGDPVHVVRDGRVTFAGGDPCCSYGFFVIVEHDEGWSSLYGHFERIDVSAGDEVKQGQVIGLAGGTGTATGPHVHFELRHLGGLVDPLQYLEPHRDWEVTAELLAERNSPSQAEDTANGQARVGAETSGALPPPVPSPTKERDTSLDAGSAIALGAQWLSRQEQSAYSIDTVSCVAAQSGPNWWVTCDGQLQGCRNGTACAAQLTACVFDQPRIVAAACS